ncbi:unnamed protein product [Withania somnifera]
MQSDAYLTIPFSFEDIINEENTYLLCKMLCDDGLADIDGSDLLVIFISNEKKQIPLWHQKASQCAEGVILWDYHVIYVQVLSRCACPIFLRHFASDRRHMKDSAGNWIAEPPSHEAIVAEDNVVNNVEVDTINADFSEKLGVVVGENDLLGFFSLIS